ncbi:DUF2642 domain-containing protein [Biomaibacter acetigenes]|uniref:DUF2642 domain-containing protein n=1 Tax=Biomaibacter acetigenes TaxID=2316383 RepID=UPI0013CEFE0E|nr:DUF2642 domain-containing protein [Biomaibacter acetigenes]
MPENSKAEALLFGGENRIFLGHLREMIGSSIDVGLTSGIMISGRLVSVFVDHILVENPQGRYHIRLTTIEYVRRP